jgi:hypothetical protein
MLFWIAETLVILPVFALITLVGGLWAHGLHADRVRGRFSRGAALATWPLFGALIAAVIVTLLGMGAPGTLNARSLAAAFALAAGAGAVLVWRGRARRGEVGGPAISPLAFDERVLIGLMAAALVVRAVTIAYWPFMVYDTLWVYGYEGRLFSLLGHIPSAIGYYPPFMAAQYTIGYTAGQAVFGVLTDHAARAALIGLHAASFGAVYTLGRVAFAGASAPAARRIGVYAAAVWALYPHVGEWSRAGDLEIALASWAALCAAFTLDAWRTGGRQPGTGQSGDGLAKSRRSAVLAGLMLAGGLWTKPTMGAFIWGIGLLVVFEAVRAWRVAEGERGAWLRGAWLRVRPYAISAALILGVGGVLGGGWYVRNFALGHALVEFPPAFWQTQAARSSAELGWPLLALGAAVAVLAVARAQVRWALVGAAALVLAAGTLPTLITPGRIGLIDGALIVVGGAGLASLVFQAARRRFPAASAVFAPPLVLACVFIAPYAVTWFWSYSYHYRLQFAIVPVLILPVAAAAAWLGAQVFSARTHRPQVRALATAAICTAALPGIVSSVYDTYAGWDYLLTDALPTDDDRYRSGNRALMAVVDGLRAFEAERPGDRVLVSAPGVQALPFFFPLNRIVTTHIPLRRDEPVTPTRLHLLDGFDYFVFGSPESEGAYDAVPAARNQVLAALGRRDIFPRAWGYDDGIFRYDVFAPNLALRTQPPAPNGPAAGAVVFGSPAFAQFIGSDIGGLELWPGRRVVLKLYWRVLGPAAADYTTFIHLRAPDGTLLATWDGVTAPYTDNRGRAWHYATTLWETGETVVDERVLELPPGVPEGTGYALVIGFYDAAGTRAPLSREGVPVGEGEYTVDTRFSVVPPRE